MRAVVYERYGPPDVLRVANVPVPVPGPDQVVVAVAATGINLSDWECLIGRPAYARIAGLRTPSTPVLGSDIAGTIRSVGVDVTDWDVGDEVVADNLWLKGGFAECALVPAKELARKPASLSFEQAAAIPQPAAVAAAGTAGLREGDRLLVNGGGGGVGVFAIPLAKQAGAHVTGVDDEAKLDFMRGLGADDVLDYRIDDFARRDERWDRILDLVATRPPRAVRRALMPGGTYWAVGGNLRAMLRILVGGAFAGRVSGRRITMLRVHEGPAAFGPILDRCAAREIDVHIGETFTLDQVPDALAAVGAGTVAGKAIVRPG